MTSTEKNKHQNTSTDAFVESTEALDCAQSMHRAHDARVQQDLHDERMEESDVDVLICGGGLAGLTLARQLRREHPTLKVMVAERSKRPIPDAAHKVGESSVELGSQYLESLGLKEYLVSRHLFKHGLRFYPGGGRRPLAQRIEIGSSKEPIVPSYQIDRGRFEQDLRGMVEEDGVMLREGVTVGQINLHTGDTPHEVHLSMMRPEERAVDATALEVGAAPGELVSRRVQWTVRCRWVVDATGRNALLRRRMKMTRGTKHVANAAWFRVAGKVDITELGDSDEHGQSALETTDAAEARRAWREAAWAGDRWRSTNHLMGEGYWAWIIPLATGNTSIGLVVHDAYHGFDKLRSRERMLAFLGEHEPVLAAEIARREILDFGSLQGYSHGVARSFSPDRWAIVGEAGAFADPLYSPGTDLIAFANSFTAELIRTDLEGGNLGVRANELGAAYRSVVMGNVDLFRDAAKVYGHPSAMLAKVYWDNFSYWSYPCQFFLQKLYRLSGHAFEEVTAIGQRYVSLSRTVQTILALWADMAPEGPTPGFRNMPVFPSVLVDAHLALEKKMSPSETVAYMTQRLSEAEVIVSELLLHALFAVGEAQATQLLERSELASKGLTMSERRLQAIGTVGLARRRALSVLARDVERALGRPLEHRMAPERVRELLAGCVTVRDDDHVTQAVPGRYTAARALDPALAAALHPAGLPL